MVAVELQGNYTDAECLNTHKTVDLINAYQNNHQKWKDSQVVHVNRYVLDNEAPCQQKTAICDNVCTT